jgi:hypothetical protein
MRTVREGPKPQGGRARSGGVGPHHTIDEPDEQRRAIFGGAWGEKGAGQGEHRFIQHLPDTVRGNRVYQGWRGVRGATLRVIYPRREPYAGKPLVRFCAGGDQQWSSLPRQLTPGALFLRVFRRGEFSVKIHEVGVRGSDPHLPQHSLYAGSIALGGVADLYQTNVAFDGLNH